MATRRTAARRLRRATARTATARTATARTVRTRAVWARAALAGAALAGLAAGLLTPASALADTQPHPAPTARNVCGPARPGFARCLAMVATGVRRHTLASPDEAPPGYSPASLRSAYRLPAGHAGAGRTVAIVDAYDDPDAASDLAVYRREFGLPACTMASGCFRKVSQDGSTTSYPAPSATWSVEISLDLDMVSAICPECHILLVEADDDSFTNLGLAVDEAVALGAMYVSNSYGGTESEITGPTEASLDRLYYDHPGVAVTAAAGDDGYGVNYPAASPDVTAVGGTTLTRDAGSTRGWTETAWSGTGSGCSAAEAKPTWQADTGCGHRTVTDVSAVADPDTGVASYDSYPATGFAQGWNMVGGTSAASPIIASVYALAGLPSTAASPASYPYRDPDGLNDVTSGGNGTCTPAYLCTAGPGYDGPTGLGTPDGTAAFGYAVHGPHGVLTGVLTSAATGRPLAGAQVTAGGYTATTDPAGRYRLAVPPGAQDVTVTAYGYATHTDPGVPVTAGATLTEDFALASVPFATLSGTVADGSGSHWPLAAEISVPGTPAAAYSNPVTGRYRLRLPAGSAFGVQVAPVYPGYQTVQQDVTVPTSGLHLSFAPQADGNACDAPGYHNVPVLTENFDTRTLPAGWSVTNVRGDGRGNTWRFNRPGGWPNATGGSGAYATAYQANDAAPIDTELTTPVIDLSAGLYPSVRFDDWVRSSAMTEWVDVSTDGGTTWSTAWINNGFAPTPFSVPLPTAAGKSSVRLRFGLSESAEIGAGPEFWQLDDVSVASCQAAHGGLLVGHVADANTGAGVDGATVTAGLRAGQGATSGPVAGDPRLGHGFYWLYSGHTGSVAFTTTAAGYVSGTGTATMKSGQVTQTDFTLAAGRLAVTPGSVTATETIGGRSSATLTVSNTGTAPASLDVSPQPGGFTMLGAGATAAGATALGAPSAAGAPSTADAFGAGSAATPVQHVAGHFSPRPGAPRPGALRPGGRLGGTGLGGTRQHGARAGYAGGTSWVPVASLPRGLYGSAAAVDPGTGDVYVVGGSDGESTYALAGVLDPATGQWSALPAPRYARFGGQAAFIGGKLYVTGGTGVTSAIDTLEIYDPASRTWAEGTPVPHAYYGAAVTVLAGKMYVIGGCDLGSGECTGGDVQVYNPGTGQWSQAASYPSPAGELGCGAISGRIYCAGGLSGPATSKAGYVYDPAANAWHRIAALPVPVWGSAYAAAGGKLLMSGGVIDASTELTNQGYAYDPARNTWSPLPGAPVASYESAAACGFYVIGGNTAAGAAGNAAQLPGYGGCGGPGWLSASPARATLAPGQSATVTVGLAALAPSVTQPGTYTATLRIAGDTPYPAVQVPVTLTALPPRGWGEITGTISGTTCAGVTSPLPGASVQIDGRHGTWLLGSDTQGRYALWLAAGNDPLTVIAGLPGWQSQTATAAVQPGSATTSNLTLTAAGCG